MSNHRFITFIIERTANGGTSVRCQRPYHVFGARWRFRSYRSIPLDGRSFRKNVILLITTRNIRHARFPIVRGLRVFAPLGFFAVPTCHDNNGGRQVTDFVSVSRIFPDIIVNVSRSAFRRRKRKRFI